MSKVSCWPCLNFSSTWGYLLIRSRFDRAFVDFFEDEMVRLSYDWKEVVAEYLFTDKEPMFDSIMASRMFFMLPKKGRSHFARANHLPSRIAADPPCVRL
jgi:hypothetical protein